MALIDRTVVTTIVLFLDVGTVGGVRDSSMSPVYFTSKGELLGPSTSYSSSTTYSFLP